jgi:hypothetical protein
MAVCFMNAQMAPNACVIRDGFVQRVVARINDSNPAVGVRGTCTDRRHPQTAASTAHYAERNRPLKS